jgi:regulator of RNase E activity RraA
LDSVCIVGAAYGIGPLTIKRRIARTVKLGAVLPNLPRRHLGTGAIMAADEGDILVIYRGRTDVSGWGGLLSRGAVTKQISGVVVDGAVRDIDEAAEFNFPVYARAAVPITAHGRVAEHDFECPVTIAGIAVMPGDWVLADGSGVVFVPVARIDEVLGAAERIFAREQLMAQAIGSGQAIGDVMGADCEDMKKGPT